MWPTNLAVVNADLSNLKRLLRAQGMPARLIATVETRALRSMRKTTGPAVFHTNRQSRWNLVQNDPEFGTDPQFGTEVDCKVILIRLLGMILEFRGAPTVNAESIEICARYLDRPLRDPGTYRDSLTLEILDYDKMVAENDDPEHGNSSFHIGHEDPQLSPKHVPQNIAWRTKRSNLIQGDMTLPEARSEVIKILARYLELGRTPILADPDN